MGWELGRGAAERREERGREGRRAWERRGAERRGRGAKGEGVIKPAMNKRGGILDTGKESRRKVKGR